MLNKSCLEEELQGRRQRLNGEPRQLLLRITQDTRLQYPLAIRSRFLLMAM